jgi:CP family cyanate transporter-like MFS transporter
MKAGETATPWVGRGPRLLPAACLLLLALNLRPVVNAVGAVVPQMRADTGMSASTTGLLLSLPMLAFALLGVAAPVLAARFGAHRTVVVTLVALAVGQLLRVAVPGIWALFGGSVVALAGIAVGNVVLPGLVRLHFADRIPVVTAAYTTTLTVGAAGAVALSNPIEHALHGSWRIGLGVWAVVALVALLPWLVLTRSSAGSAGSGARAGAAGERLPLRTIAQTRVGWSLALYFGLQAMLAYVIMGWLPEILTQRGISQTAAALQVAIIIAVGIPPAALVSGLLGRLRRPELLVIALTGCYVAGFLGLIPARGHAVVICSVLIGIGTAAFPMALSLIALRSRTALATTSLSAFTQCVGYLVAAVGPVAFGALYQAVGSWTPPLLLLAAGAVAQAVFGTRAVRAGTVEDELAAAAQAPAVLGGADA